MSAYHSFGSNPVYKKIAKIYGNFGIDVTEMEEDEVQWLVSHYANNKELLDKDLKNSEEHKDKFDELI